MKPRTTLKAIVGAALLVGAVVGTAYLTAPNPAGADVAAPNNKPIANGALVAVADQQNLQTDDGGRVVLDLRNGEEQQSCLADRIDAFLVQNARNNDPLGSFAVSVQAVENTDCTVKLRFFDVNNVPLGDENLRIAYYATTQAQSFAQTFAPAEHVADSETTGKDVRDALVDAGLMKAPAS